MNLYILLQYQNDIVVYLILLELTSAEMHHSALRWQRSRKNATSPFLAPPLPPTLKSMVLFLGFSNANTNTNTHINTNSNTDTDADDGNNNNIYLLLKLCTTSY